MLVRSMRCDLGVMISGSHNAWQDNGIKLFGQDGRKLSEEVERSLEERLQAYPTSHTPGRPLQTSDAPNESTMPSVATTSGSRPPSPLTSDLTASRSWSIAPTARLGESPRKYCGELGADVVAMGCRARWHEHQPRLRFDQRPTRWQPGSGNPGQISVSRWTETPTGAYSPTRAGSGRGRRSADRADRA